MHMPQPAGVLSSRQSCIVAGQFPIANCSSATLPIGAGNSLNFGGNLTRVNEVAFVTRNTCDKRNSLFSSIFI